jgi:nitronate monooxygenase
MSMGVQVSTGEGASRALDLGAAHLVCQGTEARGHVQALSPLSRTLDMWEAAGCPPPGQRPGEDDIQPAT